MANNFFAGCESWMEDAPVQEDNVSIAEVIESVTQASEEIEQDHEFTHEINTVVEQATMLAAKAAELDRMTTYVKTYGVDRSFLSLCNHHNQLATLGMQMPACESFDAVGDPRSATSQAAMEGIASGVRTVYEFIKKIIARCVDWLSRILHFYDVRRALLSRKVSKLKEIKVSELSQEKNGGETMLHDPREIESLLVRMLSVSQKEYEAYQKMTFSLKDKEGNDTGNTKFLYMDTFDVRDPKGQMYVRKVSPELKASSVETANVSKYAEIADKALKGFDDLFRRAQEFRKELSKVNIEKADLDSNSEEYKAKAETAKELAKCVRRCKYSLGVVLTCGSDAAKSGLQLAELRGKKEGKTGTESFSFAGLEASKDGSVIENLSGEGSYDKTQKRNQYLKDATEIQKKIIAAIQKAAGGKKQYKDLSAVLPKITVSPEDMCENDAMFSKNKEWVYVLFKADTHWANYILTIFGLFRAVQHYTAYDAPGIGALPKGVKIARTLAGSNEFAISFCDNYKKK